MLQTRFDQLSSNYSQIQSNVSDKSIEISQLQSSYETLSVNLSQLQDEVKTLKTRIKEKLCPDRWKRFGCSFYFKSEKRKYWYGSRDDCEQSGAHLVVINNEEEQKFVTELSKDGEYWIGLRYGRRQGEYKWQWVDGSPLTETFWASGLPHDYGNFTAVTCCDQQGKWRQRRNDGSYHGPKKWICEKEIH
ncbi:CD209 antigen-like protein E [Perca fluviatilis]|uniref:CD209 antigen-like protein E n=1 Tax=Perca fluviatilis TaxID=8168 RepID=UPI001965B5ED|nr:CD209 antigen-like protein E [Perca fluviatilis]